VRADPHDDRGPLTPIPLDIRVHGRRLEAIELPGDSSRAAIVLLHEGLGSVGLWRDVPRALQAVTGRRVIVYSRFGHGRSDPPPQRRTPRFFHEEALDVLPSVLEQAGVHRPLLVGHSDGASIAIIATGMGAVAPRALILEAPHVFVEELTIESISRTADRYRSTDLRDRLARHHGANVDTLFEDWTRVWLSPEFAAWNIEACLAGVNRPTLVIQGEGDEYGTPAQVNAIATALGQSCEALILPDCRHTPHVDQRAAVEDAMVRFVQWLPPSGGGSSG
jgi:pimeloyl-ACP methyl ester carboxylesterase